MSFYQTNTKILTKSIKGAETIDFNKYPDLLDILFNHWITQKENYNRLNDNFERGEFKLSLTVIKNEFGVSDRKSRTLISNFVKDEIIRLKIKGTSANKKSIYVYLSVLENIENSDIVNDIVTTQFRHSKTLKNEHVGNNKRHSKDIVSDIVVNNSKKELIKKNYKKDIYSEITERFNSTCSGLSKVVKITDKRKKVIDARIKEYDKETIYKVFDMVSNNRFLNGDSKKGWKADFDWLLNPNNFIKVLEGNYQNQKQQIIEQPKAQLGKSSIDYSKMTPEQIMALGRGEGI